MASSLSKIRDLVIIVGIYLYFIAWVYVHFYYQQFGLSTSMLKIDYAAYLMYSYNVMISENFLFWLILFVSLVILRVLVLGFIRIRKKRSLFLRRLSILLQRNTITRLVRKPDRSYSLVFLVAFMVIIFPLLFNIARKTALENYRDDRFNTQNLKTIQFIFRKDAEGLSPAVALDSTGQHTFMYDISVLKKDTAQILRLLGESDNYYIVLHQFPYNKVVKALPQGLVYFVNKKDVLLTKIILRSL